MYPGSHDMLVRQNEELNRLQLPRIADEGELIRYEVSQSLVPVAETDALKLAADLPESRRYCRPWTRDFLQDFSQAYYNQFHSSVADQFAGAHHGAAGTAAASQPLRRAGVGRHRFHPLDRSYLRSVAPRLDHRSSMTGSSPTCCL